MVSWTITNNEIQVGAHNLAKELNVDPKIAQLLFQRGIETFDEAKSFFRPSLDQLHDPFLMKDMDLAVNRLVSALDQKQKILVFGDYDVDGTTAVSLLYSFLISIGANAGYYVPDRYGEGYGISFKGIDYASEHHFNLIVALDCGIKSIDKIDYANEKNLPLTIDFLV